MYRRLDGQLRSLRLRRPTVFRNALVGVITVSTIAGIACADYIFPSSKFSLFKSTDPASFKLSYRIRNNAGAIGTATTTIPYLSQQEVENRIGQLNKENAVTRHRGIKWRWHTAQLNSNEPIEDMIAHRIVEKHKKDGDYMFFAVMDGHGGSWTSRLLQKVLIPSVALEIQLLSQYPDAYLAKPKTALEQLKLLVGMNPRAADDPAYKGIAEDPKYVSLAMQSAFRKVDQEIINAPLRLLKNSTEQLLTDPMTAPSLLPSLSGKPSLLPIILPA